MMKLICRKLLFGLVFTYVFFSCGKTHPDTEITQIELSKINSLNAADVTAISIDSSLSVKYHGLADKPVPANYQGKIPQDLWDSLTHKLENLKFKTLDTADKGAGQLDGDIYSLTIHWKGGKRKIWRGEEYETRPLGSLFGQLLTINKKIKLIPMTEPFRYDNIETGILPQPKPKIDQVKFPPPFPKPQSKKKDKN